MAQLQAECGCQMVIEPNILQLTRLCETHLKCDPVQQITLLHQAKSLYASDKTKFRELSPDVGTDLRTDTPSP